MVGAAGFEAVGIPYQNDVSLLPTSVALSDYVNFIARPA